MKESMIFYPARGTTKMEAQPEGNRTQYGWTSTFCGLQLHAGDHTYHKRGGLYTTVFSSRSASMMCQRSAA